MKRLFTTILLSFFCLGATFNSSTLNNSRITGTKPLFMPLGDSITKGSLSGSVESLGYRGPIHTRMGTISFDFVGPYQNPAADNVNDTDHAGVGGERSDEIEARTSAALITYMTNPPDNSLVAVMAGTNDVSQSIATATIVDNVEDIVDLIVAHDVNIDIYVFLITPVDNANDADTTTYNTALKIMLQTYQASKSNLYIVDVNSTFKNDTHGLCSADWATNCIGADNVHPTVAGYSAISRQIEDCISNKNNVNCF